MPVENNDHDQKHENGGKNSVRPSNVKLAQVDGGSLLLFAQQEVRNQMA